MISSSVVFSGNNLDRLYVEDPKDKLTSYRPAMKIITVRLLEYENFVEIGVRCVAVSSFSPAHSLKRVKHDRETLKLE